MGESIGFQRKLGLNDGSKVFALGVPATFLTLAKDDFSGAAWVTNPATATHWFWFCHDLMELHNCAATCGFDLPVGGRLWTCWPKKSSGFQRDLGDAEFRAMLLPTGLVDNKVAALGPIWSGLQWVHRVR